LPDNTDCRPDREAVHDILAPVERQPLRRWLRTKGERAEASAARRCVYAKIDTLLRLNVVDHQPFLLLRTSDFTLALREIRA